MTAPTFSQIKALATNIRKKTNKRIIGVRAQGRWTGERHKQDGAETYLIEQCDSPLAMRIALREAPDDQTIKILITNLDWEDLGEDVLLRLARGRLHTIDSWQIVKTLFQAHLIDPRLIQPQQSWIADYLIDWVPLEGYPAVGGGFLDAETVWSILLKQGIGLTDNQPDLLAILKWSTNAENIALLREAPEEFRKSALDWLTGVAGSLTKTVLNCILCNDRPDAVPIGLAIGVLFHPDIDRQLDKAIGKVEERYLGGITLDVNTASRWTLIAAECLQFDSAQRNQLLQRTDQILHEVGAEAFAYLSHNSPTGFDQRLARLGKCLVSALEEKNSAALEQLFTAYQSVLAHDPKPLQEHRRLERVEMALRLVRWQLQESTKSTQPRSLAEAIAYHQKEGGFLDWARLSLRSGDQIRELSEAYTVLFEQVTAIREQQAYQFAALLQNWVEVGSTGKTVSVENILESIVAPLASHAPVLVIVMDGMSMAVCRELVADITAKQSWTSLCQEGQTAVAAGLAAIPSTTEASRTSLLCGQLKRGRATDEKRGFASLPSLLTQCRKGSAPILFHKPSLREQEDTVLADEVRKAIASSQNRIVGVVINAIDDHLSKGDQIDISWSQDEIKALSILLHEAKVSNRLVILLSDHGHVVDYGTKGKPSEGGERWRFNNSQPEKGELRISGSRVVLTDSNSLIAPWTERLRYSIKKNGYHGGLTPQEMVIPIAVLCSSTTYPTGWGEAPIDTPTWWEEATDCTEIPSLILPLQSGTSLDLGPLFNSVMEPEAAHSAQQTSQWITTLLASPIYKARKKVAGRAVPGDDVLAKVLLAMDSYSGKITLNVLSRIIGYPVARIRSLLTVIQRILNIDGYTVITIDKASDTVEINRDLLCQQFGLKKG